MPEKDLTLTERLRQNPEEAEKLAELLAPLISQILARQVTQRRGG